MARSRRRRTPTRRKARKADWVYRHHVIDSNNNPAVFDQLGTYEPGIVSHATGVDQAQSHILYDSQNYIAHVAAGGVIAPTGLPHLQGQARAEGRKPLILAVEGIVYWEPSMWALGNLMAIGMRMGVFEQDQRLGVFSLDVGYSMWLNATGAQQQRVGAWANNGRNNAWERRIHYGFSDNQAFVVVRVNWRGRRRLEPNECFGLYTELEGTSVGTRTQYWLRTLVADEG